MRWLLGCSIVLSAAAAWADCANSGWNYWPPAEVEIGKHPVLLIEGYASDQPAVKTLNAVHLSAPGHRVQLNRLAVHQSRKGLTQSAWTPQAALKPGLTYRLVLAGYPNAAPDGKVVGMPKSWTPKRRTLDYTRTVPVQWTVAKAPLEAAAWNGNPSLGDSNYQAFGCGPAISQAVALPVTGSLALVEVTLRHADQTQRYLLPVNGKGEISIGHGMCSGEFSISQEGTYDAHFALLRPDGTREPAPQNLRFPGIIDIERVRMNERLRTMKPNPAFKSLMSP